MQQKRLILALVLSSAILFLWSYLYPAKPPQNSQTSGSATITPEATASQPSSTSQTGQPPTGSQIGALAQNSAPQRTLTIRTPLYEIKIDSRGAAPISWIIKENKKSTGQKDIFSVAGTRRDAIPLQLISPEGLNRQPREVPLQLLTGDAGLDEALRSSTYRIDGVNTATGDAELTLAAGEKKQIQLVLEDSNKLLVQKTLTFDGDRYDVDLGVLIKRGDQTVPRAKLSVGPSIGDQGVKRHTFYSVAPEAVADVNDKIERHPAAGINGNKSAPDHLSLPGSVNWAAVGDTYFAMVAIPDHKTKGLEYRTIAYEYSGNSKPEKRYLITGYLPISADGGHTLIYAGPKDHYLLTEASEQIGPVVQRTIDGATQL